MRNIALSRGMRAFANIAVSFFARGLSLLIGFLLVPLTIDYITAEEYGVWLTLVSIVSWVTYFDVGLANGLRNKLVEALSQSDYLLAKEYVSTCYLTLTFLGVLFVGLFSIGNLFFNWQIILDAKSSVCGGWDTLVFIMFVMFVITFVLKTTGMVYTAYQYPVVNEIVQLIINIVILVGIFTLKCYVTPGRIDSIGYVYMGVPLAIWILAYPLAFFGRLSEVRPSWRCFRLAHIKVIGLLGVKFFLIQCVCLVLFSSTNLIITHLCGSTAVVEFNLAFRYFSVLTMAFTIIVTPYWNAVTEAAEKLDYDWIRHHVLILIGVWSLFCLVDLVMIFISQHIYGLWIGSSMHIRHSVSIAVACFTLVSMWNNVFAYVLNGLSIVNLQIITSLAGLVLFAVLCLTLGRTFGVSGIVWSGTIALLISGIILPMQCKMVLAQRCEKT